MNLKEEQKELLCKIVDAYKGGCRSQFLVVQRYAGDPILVYSDSTKISIRAEDTDFQQLASEGFLTLSRNSKGLLQGKVTADGIRVVETNVEEELSRKKYFRHLIKTSWQKTKESGTPWINRVKEHVIASAFLLLAVAVTPAALGQWYAGREVFGGDTLLQVAVIAGVMGICVFVYLCIVFGVHFVNAPFAFHKEGRREAEKWSAKLDTQSTQSEGKIEELGKQIEGLKSGPSKEDLVRHLLAEMERNKERTGMRTTILKENTWT